MNHTDITWFDNGFTITVTYFIRRSGEFPKLRALSESLRERHGVNFKALPFHKDPVRLEVIMQTDEPVVLSGWIGSPQYSITVLNEYHRELAHVGDGLTVNDGARLYRCISLGAIRLPFVRCDADNRILGRSRIVSSVVFGADNQADVVINEHHHGVYSDTCSFTDMRGWL